jgi:chorismate mutase/prephenate dehydratase
MDDLYTVKEGNMAQEVINDTTSNLSEVRANIDNVDKQLLQLLAQRRGLAEQVIRIKSLEQSPLRDEKREANLLRARIADGRTLGLNPQLITSLFHEILADSNRAQQDVLQAELNGVKPSTRPTRVAFQGIDGSYSHLVGRSIFGNSTNASKSAAQVAATSEFVGFPSYKRVVEAVENGDCDCAILPIENTTSGAINDVYDLLLNSRVSIVGEEKFNIKHCLIGLEDVPVSHLQVIHCSQIGMTECSQFLSDIPTCSLQYAPDSAMAMKKLHESGNKLHAAIGSEEAAEMLGLKVLKRGIADHEENFTRYLVVAKTPIKVDSRVPSKVSVVMNTLNKAGALVDTLVVFKEAGINLTKLESRPIPGNSWEEMFYIDFTGNLDDQTVKVALGEITKLARFIKVLGCYPACDVTPTAVPESAGESCDESQGCGKKVHIEVTEKPAPKSSGKDKGYKLASREHKSSNTIINVGGVSIGDGNFLVIAGPCSVESREQIMSCAKEARDNGARILRGGVFKPRTSPYSFQGLGYEGLDMLVEAGKAFGMPVITEVMTTEDVERVAEKADIIQIGARNMQNYSLLKAIGETRRPVMLKRGLSAPIEELLQATEYILAGGNQQVFLCERGIRTFETATRGTLDISAVPVLKAKTHLPVFIDPSHAAGVRELVPPLAMAAKAVGADGIIVEFHPEPEKALSDGPQALRFHEFEKMMVDLRKIER